MISNAQKKTILTILNTHGLEKAWIFGSYARNENKPDSDLDLMIKLNKRLNLLDFIGIEQELSEALGIKVDLVMEGSLDPLIKPYVEMDIKPLMVNEE